MKVLAILRLLALKKILSQSDNVESASNMIPCFPASNGTDAHHCDTISNRSSLSHFTKDSPSNISQNQNQANYKQFMPLLGKSKRILKL